jgi:outer membrane protein TolC
MMRSLTAVVLISGLSILLSSYPVSAPAQDKKPGPEKKRPGEEELPPPRVTGADLEASPWRDSILSPVVETIDLAAALRLAGVQNPAILQAREQVVTAVIERQLAAAVFLPSLNAGLNYDAHTGPLQQSNGNILKVNRSALYVGAGANAVAAGSVNIPGVVFNYNASEAIFGFLAAKQQVAARRFASRAAHNEGLRRVAVAYLDLLAAEAGRAVAVQTRSEAGEIKRLCVEGVKAGSVRQGDADRAINEFELRTIDLIDAERLVQQASARLAELINLDPATRLHPAEERLVPMPIVPDPIPLPELLAIALLQRPEMGQRQALVRQAMLQLSNAKLLPFSPNLIVGFSAGTFGGGSDLVTPAQPKFGNFGPRNDFDVIAFWTLQNMGIGNVALVRMARSKLSESDLERLKVLNMIRGEVANAYIRTHVRFAQITAVEAGISAGKRAYDEDYKRVFGRVGLPIELLQSFKLLYQARTEYLNAIADYNRAQLELYVAMGQPPADSLARPYARAQVELAATPERPDSQ